MIIGIISDTHGAVSREALKALKGVRCILHAGDIGSPEVIVKLEQVAPVKAVRGNTDSGGWVKQIPFTEMVSFASKTIYILHDLSILDLDPKAAGIQVIISGHTHQAEVNIVNDIIYFNPGSASIRRYGGPLTVGRIKISANDIQPEIIHLSD